MEVHLIGAGPSAMQPPVGATVAAVNDKYKTFPPDYYLVGEIEAAKRLEPVIRTLLDRGTTAYMRPNAAIDDPRVQLIGKNFGPRRLQHLHHDVGVPHAGVQPGLPRPRCPNAWISSGVLMLWVLAEIHKPERVVVSGLDGYPPENAYLKAMNERMSYAIGLITNHYTDTEFVWLIEPRHRSPDWRAKISQKTV